MNMSSRFSVAVHILSGLAIVWQKKPQQVVSSENIAWSVNTNPVVVRRLLGRLQKAGLIRSFMGIAGGAKLTKDPAKINLLEIYRVVEDGALVHLHYRKPNKECPVGANIAHALAEPLNRAVAAFEKELRRTTLLDIAEAIIEKAGLEKTSQL